MSEVKVDTISERTAAGGVTIDGVLIKDGVATFQTAAGSPLVFEGATADAFETTFAITDPTADRTITFPDADVTLGAATLAPAFTACANADVTISDATDTKVTLNREVFDSNSAFDPTTNYRFTVPAGEGGKYLIAAGVSFGSTVDMEVVRVHIKKGGSTIASNEWSCGATYIEQGLLSLTLTCVLDLSATNYVELFGYLDSASGTRTIKGDSTIQESWMSGFKLVGI